MMSGDTPSTHDDPSAWPLDALRAERARLQAAEDAVSYVRRLVQGRLDLVRAERRHRTAGEHLDLEQELAGILAGQVGGGSARPPRATHIPDDHPLLAELERRCERLGFDDLTDLGDEALAELERELDTFEHLCSGERHALFQRIDVLTADLVRRYRDGAATVEGLLDE
jgi:hypothetical protein